MVIAREGYATTVDKFTTDDNGEITKTYTLKLALVTYSVTTLFDDTKGKLAARPSTGVTKDALVELTIKPNTGYQLTEGSLKAYKSDEPAVTVTLDGMTFKMPAYNVTMECAFALKQYTVSFEANGASPLPAAIEHVDHGTIIAKPSEVPVLTGKSFKYWS